ncbi:GDSL-type esterase/lipase family protein [Acididesulfobacillus acetoxydans]|nr:GDSL-type esterase/lipase family protein [Acididesulfobacillus acetoxydans]
MRKKHPDIRIVVFALMMAVMVIIVLDLRANEGHKQPSGSPVATGQLKASESAAAVTQHTQPNQDLTPAQDHRNEGTPQPLNSKIVTVGDSFTYGNPVGPGNSWPHWVGSHLGIPVINEGRVGQTSQDVLAHFDPDVVAQKPGRVIIFVGDGDAIQRVSEADYQNAVEAMVERARANHIIPILALPLPYPGLGQRIKAMQDWLRGYAKEGNIQTLDFAKVLFDSKGVYLKGMSNDGKYPSLQGYEAMGKYAVELLGGG